MICYKHFVNLFMTKVHAIHSYMYIVIIIHVLVHILIILLLEVQDPM